MKKPIAAGIVFFLSAFIILVMSCEDDDIGLGTSVGTTVPENLFAGGAWEQTINENIPMFKTYRKLSFTANTFALYEERQDSSITYTGTYSLFYNDNSEYIKFISDEPTLNGDIRYSFGSIYDPQDNLYPENSVVFSIDSSFPINGVYTPTNN